MTKPENHIRDYSFELECPSCQNTISVFDDTSQLIRCPNCQSIIEAKNNLKEAVVLKEIKTMVNKPWSFLQIGQRFRYGGILYYITGRVTASVFYTDHEAEEGADPYGNVEYQEWFCMSEEGDEISITQDKYGFSISFPSDEMYEFEDSIKMIEDGKSLVLYFEGETTNYHYYPGTKFAYRIYRAPFKNQKFGLEYTRWNDPETHYTYQQQAITAHKLRKIIEEDNDISIFKKNRNNYNFLRGALIFCAFLMIPLLVRSNYDQNGETIYKAQAFLKDTPPYGQDFKDKPIQIDDIDKIYEIEISGYLMNNRSDVYTSIEILDENKSVINLILNDFYYYYGVSGSEKWVDKSLSAVNYFSFEKPGNYYVRFYYEKGEKTQISINDYMFITVRKGAFLSRYFIFALAFFILLIILNYAETTKWSMRDNYLRLFNKMEKFFIKFFRKV